MINQKVPVLFTIFNRRDVSVEAFQCIKQYQPDYLYISADGHRVHKKGEDVLCEETRQAVLDEIDWPCKVKTLFQKENKGCAYAMYEGISWFFENEEWGVICEDDVILSPDFFKICEELLPKYVLENRLMAISAENNIPTKLISNSFVYTNAFYCWGWASWRRAWKKMDMELSFWPKCSMLKLIFAFGLFRGLYYYCKVSVAYRHLESFNSWATRFYLSIFYHKGLVLLPKTNLSLNIGQNIEGAHYNSSEQNLFKHLKMGNMKFPLLLPSELMVDKMQVVREEKDFLRLRLYGLRKKIWNLFNSKIILYINLIFYAAI